MGKAGSEKVSETESSPNFIQNVGSFHFWNGDAYEGGFLAAKKTRQIVMEGEGAYTTGDLHVYKGVWENDSMKEVDNITFPGQTVFSGNVEDMTFQGPGIYNFKENIAIEGQFISNRLVGNLMLTDPNGHKWVGKSTLSYRDVILYPVLPFWQSVLQLPAGENQFFGEAEEQEHLTETFHLC